MKKIFDANAAKVALTLKDKQERDACELERQRLLALVQKILLDEFADTTVEVYLIGSIIKPYAFAHHSDVDIVLQHFVGDRFDIWTKIEGKLKRNVEIVLFEKCDFQSYILASGLKVV